MKGHNLMANSIWGFASVGIHWKHNVHVYVVKISGYKSNNFSGVLVAGFQLYTSFESVGYYYSGAVLTSSSRIFNCGFQCA